MWHSPFKQVPTILWSRYYNSISENWNSREIFFLFVSFFSSIIYLFLEIKSPKYRIILDICSLNNQEFCDELLIMHMHGCIFILFFFFLPLISQMATCRLSKSPSSDFIWRNTKDFSYLISANFTDPKTGRCGWTNQSSSQRPLGIKLSLTSTKRIETWLEVDCEVEGVEWPNTTHQLVIVWYVSL